MYILTAAATDSILSSRLSPAFCTAITNYSSISGQLRLKIIHLTREDTHNIWMTRLRSRVKSVTHSSSAPEPYRSSLQK